MSRYEVHKVVEDKEMTEFGREVETLYLNESYLFTNTVAVITDINKLEEGDPSSKHGTHCMKLNKHIFHPQGGGQPSDIGSVEVKSEGEDNVLSFLVKFVAYSPENREVLLHYGSFGDSSMESKFHVGLEVNLSVDAAKRALHSRLHSAGHAIDACLSRLGMFDRLKAEKGYHFIDSPYVEYTVLGDLSAEEMKMLPSQLSEQMGNLINEGIVTDIVYMSREEAAMKLTNCDVSNYPDTIRVVYVAGLPCPCGGTHVDSTSDLQKVTITKVNKKKGKIRISYNID